MSPRITILSPCRDERENIGDCIESARLIADEILVADSGSTDNTVQIVRKAGGCRLIEREWNGYAAFKNWAIPQATHSWVLLLDADERVTEELASEIRSQLASCSEDVDAWKVGFKTFFMGHELRFSNWNRPAVRLIRRDACRYADTLVHEEFDVDPGRVRNLRNLLKHYSIRNYDQYFEKYLRYTELSARQKWRSGRRATIRSLLFRPFLRFFHLYILRRGFLDGRAGIQVCLLNAFFNTFVKQARLWEKEQLAVHQSSAAPYAALVPVPAVGHLQTGSLQSDRIEGRKLEKLTTGS
jgi:glycosyltransferase involved in cell wall biosynthesis